MARRGHCPATDLVRAVPVAASSSSPCAPPLRPQVLDEVLARRPACGLADPAVRGVGHSRRRAASRRSAAQPGPRKDLGYPRPGISGPAPSGGSPDRTGRPQAGPSLPGGRAGTRAGPGRPRRPALGRVHGRGGGAGSISPRPTPPRPATSPALLCGQTWWILSVRDLMMDA